MVGPEGPDGPVNGVPPTLELDAEAAHALYPDGKVHSRSFGERLQLVEDVAGKVATGKLAVDAGHGAAPGVLAPVRGNCGLYFHSVFFLFLNFENGPVRVEGEDHGGDVPARTPPQR